MTQINPFFEYLRSNRETSERYFYSENQPTIKKYISCLDYIKLPKPQKMGNKYSDLIEQRRSISDFKDTKYTLQDLSTILYWSVADLGEKPNGQGGDMKMQRPCPSGGGKYPIETYIMAAEEGKELKRGMYHYRPDDHALELISNLSEQEVLDLKNAQTYKYVLDVPIMLLYTFMLSRSMRKYGTLAYQLGLIEAGHIGQNVYLSATALNYHCNAVLPVAQEKFHSHMQIYGNEECMCYSIMLGKK